MCISWAIASHFPQTWIWLESCLWTSSCPDIDLCFECWNRVWLVDNPYCSPTEGPKDLAPNLPVDWLACCQLAPPINWTGWYQGSLNPINWARFKLNQPHIITYVHLFIQLSLIFILCLFPVLIPRNTCCSNAYKCIDNRFIFYTWALVGDWLVPSLEKSDLHTQKCWKKCEK